MVTQTAARIGWAIVVGVLLTGPATAQQTVQGAAPLGCGLVGFSAVGTGPLAPTVDNEAVATVASLPLTQPCDGVVVATFTADLSTTTLADVTISLQARCTAPPPAVLGNCQPGSVVPLWPGEFTVPNICSCVPDARTVSGAVSLTKGDYLLEVVIRSLTGDVKVEKSLLSVVVAAAAPAPPPPPPPAPPSAGRP